MALRSDGWATAAAVATVATMLLLLKPAERPPPSDKTLEDLDGIAKMPNAIVKPTSPTLTITGIEIEQPTFFKAEEAVQPNAFGIRDGSPALLSGQYMAPGAPFPILPTVDASFAQGASFTAPPFVPYGDLASRQQPLQGLFWQVQRAVNISHGAEAAALLPGDPRKLLAALQGRVDKLDTYVAAEAEGTDSIMYTIARYISSMAVDAGNAFLHSVGFPSGVRGLATSVAAIITAAALTGIGYYMGLLWLGLIAGVLAALLIFVRDQNAASVELPHGLPEIVRQWNSIYPQYSGKLFHHLEAVTIMGVGINSFYFVDPDNPPLEPITGRPWRVSDSLRSGRYNLRVMTPDLRNEVMAYDHNGGIVRVQFPASKLAMQVYDPGRNLFQMCLFHLPEVSGEQPSWTERKWQEFVDWSARAFSSNEAVVGIAGSTAYCVPGSGYKSRAQFEESWRQFVERAADFNYILDATYGIIHMRTVKEIGNTAQMTTAEELSVRSTAYAVVQFPTMAGQHYHPRLRPTGPRLTY